MDRKKRNYAPQIRFDTSPEFKRTFQVVWEAEGFHTESHALSVIVKDWVSKRRGPQEIINEKLLEGEKKAHLAVFGEVQKDEQGNVKNVFNIMNNQ